MRETMKADPFSGAVYVFRARRADRVKLIFWDGTGVCLFAKRLEDGKFRWPNVQDGVMWLAATSGKMTVHRHLVDVVTASTLLPGSFDTTKTLSDPSRRRSIRCFRRATPASSFGEPALQVRATDALLT